MKRIILTLILAISFNSYSQELPTEPKNGFAFPLGSKFTIKMHPKDSINFDFSIINYEPFEEIINTWENDHLFKENGEKGTIEFYFCLGTRGKTDSEKEKNMKILLIMKNRTKYSFNYDSDIKKKEKGEFEKTSNVGTHSNVKGIEMWPYMIHQIGLKNFRLMK
jgi:hypothetical protein